MSVPLIELARFLLKLAFMDSNWQLSAVRDLGDSASKRKSITINILQDFHFDTYVCIYTSRVCFFGNWQLFLHTVSLEKSLQTRKGKVKTIHLYILSISLGVVSVFKTFAPYSR